MACGSRRRRDGHSSGTPVARRIKQPTRTAGPDRPGTSPAPFLFGLAPGGVCRAVSVAGNAVRSYRTVSPLPASPKRTGGLFSVALSLGFAPEGSSRRTLSGTVRPWSPDFPPRPPFGLWRGAAVRPTDSDRNGVRERPRQAGGGSAVKQVRAKKSPSLSGGFGEEGTGPGSGRPALGPVVAFQSRSASAAICTPPV